MLFGLLGEKLGHSFSPEIHSTIFKELNISGYYHLFEVKKQDLRDAVRGFQALGLKGVNVTIPYKIEVMKYLDSVSEEAKKIGAVNTIAFKDNKIIGYNTDYYGFGMMMDKFNVQLQDKRVVVLGTGGAANSVIQYVLDKNVKDITIVTRDTTKVNENFKKFNLIEYDKIKLLKQQDIIINCTPVGMYPNMDSCSIDKKEIFKFNTAVDLIYNPMETKFLNYAKQCDLKAINGLYMLVGQAVKAEEIWNDIKINDKVTEKIYKNIEAIVSGE